MANPIDSSPEVQFSTLVTRPIPTPKAQPEREVVGSWRRSGAGMHWVEAIYRESGKLKRGSLYDDGSSSIRTVSKANHPAGVKYVDRENEHGEFVVVHPDGTLGFYDQDGKFGEAVPVR